jgi:hypothetical protein
VVAARRFLVDAARFFEDPFFAEVVVFFFAEEGAADLAEEAFFFVAAQPGQSRRTAPRRSAMVRIIKQIGADTEARPFDLF